MPLFPQKFCKQNFSALQYFSEITVICMLAYAYRFRIFSELMNAFPCFIMFLSTRNPSILMMFYDAQILIIFECCGRMIRGRGRRTLRDTAVSEFSWRAHGKHRKPSGPPSFFPPLPHPLPSRLFNINLSHPTGSFSLEIFNLFLPRNLKQAEPKWKLQSLLLEISPSVPAYTTEEALRTHM